MTALVPESSIVTKGMVWLYRYRMPTAGESSSMQSSSGATHSDDYLLSSRLVTVMSKNSIGRVVVVPNAAVMLTGSSVDLICEYPVIDTKLQIHAVMIPKLHM